MSMEPVISMENVSFSYNGVTILEDVNLVVGDRDFAWIVGPNGGGKTTLLKLILGLLRPDFGKVLVFGRSTHDARVRIGYMPQQVSLDTQFPVNVMDIVLMGRLGRDGQSGFFGSADRKAASRVLELVGLYDSRKRSLAELSGGQQRRLFIARALVCEPDLLLLDEPTANLDPLVQRDLYNLLHRLNDQLTVVMVSHDPAFVSMFVKQVICVKRTVDVHPTGEVCGDILGELYPDSDLRIVRHDRHFGNEKNHD
ncbi:MAG: metal ABC transporter ATP-binding protein [candidate division Zixibacteria bacterium]|nr:metal ABC transporter ATP-binding protein [candidate division Zixibacteria bacterium]